jgi:hypothetical protein
MLMENAKMLMGGAKILMGGIEDPYRKPKILMVPRVLVGGIVEARGAGTRGGGRLMVVDMGFSRIIVTLTLYEYKWVKARGKWRFF